MQQVNQDKQENKLKFQDGVLRFQCSLIINAQKQFFDYKRLIQLPNNNQAIGCIKILRLLIKIQFISFILVLIRSNQILEIYQDFEIIRKFLLKIKNNVFEGQNLLIQYCQLSCFIQLEKVQHIMKPALLSLKSYIDQNYQKSLHSNLRGKKQTQLLKRQIVSCKDQSIHNKKLKLSQQQQTINQPYSSINNDHQLNNKKHLNYQNQLKNKSKLICQNIFKEKPLYARNQFTKREFYLSTPKSFTHLNSMLLKRQQRLNVEAKQQSKIANIYDSIEWNKKNQAQSISQNQGSAIQRHQQTQLKLKNDNQREYSSFKNQNQVVFIVSPPKFQKPIQSIPSNSQSSKKNRKEMLNNSFKGSQKKLEIQSNLQQENDQQSEDVVELLKPSIQTVTEHIKTACKSIHKIGYHTFLDYLNQMKIVSQIKHIQIRQAFYYPLSCMKVEINEAQQLQKINKQKKVQFLKHLHYYQRQIQVLNDFNTKILQFGPSGKHHAVSQKPKSKFLKKQKPKIKNDTLNQDKKQKFLLQYESIIMCNASNKRYFSYKLNNTNDYTSFFKYTCPLLQNQTIKTKQNGGSDQTDKLKSDKGLYFCCLVNVSLKINQCFFWVGNPFQYYKKHTLIDMVDQFLMEIDGGHLFQNDKIFIIDHNGTSSFIQKSLLKKYNQMKQLKISLEQSSKKCKTRISKRTSFNISQKPNATKMDQNASTSDSFFGLLSNSSQFSQSLFYKKQRNNISKRGVFKLIYDQNII